MNKNELIKTLRAYSQWVLYDLKNKRPYHGKTGHWIDITNPNVGVAYEDIEYQKNKGFILTKDDPFCCVDLDHCVKAQGQVGADTTKVLMYFQSYTEMSPSGTGFHIWGQGKIKTGIKRATFEIYSQERYITINENSVFNCQLVDCQLKLDRIYEKYGQPNLGEVQTCGESVECIDDLRDLYKVSEQLRKIWHLQCGFKKADGSPDFSSYDMAISGLLQDWSVGKIVWTIQFFRKQWGAKPKHDRAIALTISKVKHA